MDVPSGPWTGRVPVALGLSLVVEALGLCARLRPLDPGYFAHAKFRDDKVGLRESPG
jgi:hypothetical protein